MAERLIADIGGTHLRLAIVEDGQPTLSHLKVFDCAGHGSVEAVISAYLEALDRPAPAFACIAVAAALSGDEVRMVNLPWSFSTIALRDRFGFTGLRVLNDFEAVALSLPHLAAGQVDCIDPGGEPANRHLAALGPGTGLGGAMLFRRGTSCEAIACEPGHASIAPGTVREYQLFQLLQERHGELHAELLLCGPGLERIYMGLAQLDQQPVEALPAAAISAAAIDGSDALCHEALSLFCALLGSAAGDFVLHNGADGGLYLAGGIIPRFVHFLRHSDFLTRFRHKGALRHKLSQIPVYVITEPHPGLLGAAHAEKGI